MLLQSMVMRMKIIDFLTVFFGKVMVKTLHLLKRDAGNAPGLVLWTLNKKLLTNTLFYSIIENNRT